MGKVSALAKSMGWAQTRTWAKRLVQIRSGTRPLVLLSVAIQGIEWGQTGGRGRLNRSVDGNNWLKTKTSKGT